MISQNKPFAQDEGKELVDKTKLNVLLKLFNRNDWLLFNISFNIMSMPLDFFLV
jgi:succinate dehydrogenase flavin-adding protein (antitoxin of CptAB toxin-antitoxin module)